MLTLTRKTDYALVALATLADAAPAQLSARELARRAKLPLPALRNILKSLGGCGLLCSEQGAHGGYRLARSADSVTIADVVDAIEGPVRFTPCCGGTPGAMTAVTAGESPAVAQPCPLEDSCLIKGAVRRLHGRLMGLIRQVTIADLLCNREPAAADRSATTAAAPAACCAGRCQCTGSAVPGHAPKRSSQTNQTDATPSTATAHPVK